MIKFNLSLILKLIILAILGCVLFLYDKDLKAKFDDLIVLVYQKIDIPISKMQQALETTLNCLHSQSTDVTQKNEILLKEQALRIAVLQRENDELKKLNHYIDPLNFDYISAKIVNATNDISGMKFMINIGESSGISEGQAVTNEYGLVGRITKISNYSARIISVTNSHSKIPVLLLKSGIHCIAIGNGEAKNVLKLLYIPENMTPIEGEIAVTSGEGGLIPFGIKVGEVIKNHDGQDSSLKIHDSQTQPSVVAIASVNTAHDQ